MDNVERIEHKGKVFAIIVRKNFNGKGLTFVTDNEFAMQAGIHIHDKGFEVKPHKHLPFDEIKNLKAQEVFYVVRGKIVVGLYDDQGEKIKVIEGNVGDLLVLNTGHDLTCSEDAKFIEIKQGPYRGKKEKEYFG